MSNYEDEMYDDLASERHDAWVDGKIDEFDEEFGEAECAHGNPECSWVDEEDYDGRVYYWCEEHATE